MDVRYIVIAFTLAALLAWLAPAPAQEISDEATKKAALMRAYRANGNSMVGWGSYDATQKEVQVERIIPVTPATERNALDAIADMTNPDPAPAPRRADICQRHHMHKVYYGEKWRCRR